MTELGTRLKEARQSKGYSLDDLQEITKIQKRYLSAIEEGNYSIMPGAFYIRAFIKQYAEAVGLNYEQLLEEFEHEIPSHQKEEVAQSISNSPARRRLKTASSSRFMESLPKFIFALFIIVIIVAIWILFQHKADSPNEEVNEGDTKIEYDKKEVPKKQPTTNEDEGTNEEGTNGPDGENSGNQNTPQADENTTNTQTISEGVVSGQNTNYEVTGTDTLKIRVELSGDSWIEVRDESRKNLIEPRVFKNGEKIEYDATELKYVRIRLGNSNSAKIFVNDEELQLVQKRTTQNIIVELKEQQEQQTEQQTNQQQTTQQ